ncbi:hypothetical protein L917_12508 [Phytophthora nicotianae]|uniref:Uncharacterized protein n=1 Tax=Phytophthora nicotianae TaxID=4792 RepID=W2KTB2_PHYNI|nr:hypothetical protein L917_12508 [Phytophthora nicotianae]
MSRRAPAATTSRATAHQSILLITKTRSAPLSTRTRMTLPIRFCCRIASG